MSNVKVAKLFRNGGSQAVRLPAQFRFEGDEVYVRRDEETGNVILSSKTTKTSKESWEELFASLDAHDIPQADLVKFGKIVDDIVANRQNRPMSSTMRKAHWDDLFAKLDTGKTSDEELDTYMAKRPMNTPVRDHDIFGDDV